MVEKKAHESGAVKNPTTVQRKTERELLITRTFNGPVHLVFAAWTQPELLKQWWAPRSVGARLAACDLDLRAGGKYRFEIGLSDGKSLVFRGRYTEVIPNKRLVWTNEESEEGPVTTVTFEEQAGKTVVVMHEVYPTQEALDAALAGMEGGMTETFSQLDEYLARPHAGHA